VVDPTRRRIITSPRADLDACFSMTARLQEAQFACFDDGEAERFASGPEGSLGVAGLPAFAVAFPPGVRTQPAKSFARGAWMACSSRCGVVVAGLLT
jgi:hypothetical protein